MILNNDEGGDNLDVVMANDEAGQKIRRNFFKNKKFQRTLKHFLPKWDTHGLLDKLIKKK